MESAVMYKLNEQNNSLISINFQLEGISKQNFFKIYIQKNIFVIHFEIKWIYSIKYKLQKYFSNLIERIWMEFHFLFFMIQVRGTYTYFTVKHI